MFTASQTGSIEVICGSMFSGKTEELVRRLKRSQIGRQRVQVFKPAIDNRYSEDHVQSHDATRLPSIAVKGAQEILGRVGDHTRVVGIDEAQFFDSTVVDVAQKLAYRGIRVIIAGLDMDFRGQPFGPMPELLAIAESVTKLSAVCMVCGGQASRSQRLAAPEGTAGDQQVQVGAADMYEARCRFCHEPEGAVLRGAHVLAALKRSAPQTQKSTPSATESLPMAEQNFTPSVRGAGITDGQLV